MNKKLRDYLQMALVHHYDATDELYGVQTEKYYMIKRLLDNEIGIEAFVYYFEKYHAFDELQFIDRVKSLIREEE